RVSVIVPGLAFAWDHFPYQRAALASPSSTRSTICHRGSPSHENSLEFCLVLSVPCGSCNLTRYRLYCAIVIADYSVAELNYGLQHGAQGYECSRRPES